MKNDPIFIVIFTDLDGTLLDHTSYGWEEANPALDLCRRLHIPVVMVSSKTRAEMEILRHRLKLSAPFISENGGGVFFPKDDPHGVPPGTVLMESIWKLSLGMPYELLVKSLQDIREELGWHIRGFSEMTSEEISHLTGLDLVNARLAANREYDEPFIVLGQEDIDDSALIDAAKQRGLQISKGGRFYHIHGKNDKGKAVQKVISWYEKGHSGVFTIALGDSPNDFSMLKEVDDPVLIGSTHDFPKIEEMIPGLRTTKELGPKGWNSAVLDILGEKM